MPTNDDLSRLIDAARSGRLSRQEVFRAGSELGLTNSVRLALARAVPERAPVVKVWRCDWNAATGRSTMRSLWPLVDPNKLSNN